MVSLLLQLISPLKWTLLFESTTFHCSLLPHRCSTVFFSTTLPTYLQHGVFSGGSPRRSQPGGAPWCDVVVGQQGLGRPVFDASFLRLLTGVLAGLAYLHHLQMTTKLHTQSHQIPKLSIHVNVATIWDIYSAVNDDPMHHHTVL